MLRGDPGTCLEVLSGMNDADLYLHPRTPYRPP